MKKIVLACLLPVALGGCAVADQVQSRQEYKESAARYKGCLESNPATPQNCEGLRLAMETDERKFNNMGSAMSGRQGTANVNILNR
jgi:hypothetical protein